MKQVKLLIIFFVLIVLYVPKIKAQPIPIELMIGNKYGVADLAFSKKFSPESKFGFFHMNTVQFDYNEEYKNSIILQDLIYIEAIKNIRVAAGVAYTKGGFAPTAGIQYVFTGKKLMILCAPRINLVDEQSYDIMNIIQYKTAINEKLKLFTRAKFLNVFDESGNIKSYQWLRIGFETKRIQFGLAFNLDEFGPNPSVETNYGLFIRKEIF